MHTSNLATRLNHINPFHVMEIAAQAQTLALAGKDIIHLEIGQPDFKTPKPVLDAAAAFLSSGEIRYTNALGIRPLREAISQHYQRLYGLDISPERIIVTAGGSAALLLTCALLINPGNEVILSDPSYPCNRHFVRAFEGVPRCLNVGPEQRYQLSAQMIDAAWNSHTKAALIASPSNPTGTSVPKGEMQRIVDVTKKHAGILISDETYAGLNYDHPPETALAFASATDNVFSINSFSKYFTMTGWRLGWLVAPEQHVRAIEVLAQNLYISAPSLSQHAALACFTEAGYAIAEAQRIELKARRDFLVNALQSIGFKIPVLPDSGIFVYADVSAFTDDSHAFVKKVLNDTGVAFAPGIDFGEHRAALHVRMAYAVSIERLQEAVNRLRAYLRPI